MAQDRRGNALVYFCGLGGHLLSAVLHWHLDLEFVDMTQEDIIRMAEEAGKHLWPLETKFLLRFAALVAAAEREACAKMCDHVYDYIVTDGHIKDMAFKIRARGQA